MSGVAASIAASRRSLLFLAVMLLAVAASLPWQMASATSTLDTAFASTKNIWIERSVLRALPAEGPAWDELVEDARGTWGPARVADQESNHDVYVLAGALYAVRSNDLVMRTKVVAGLEAAVGTEAGGRTLALGRNLTGYVLAADIVGHRSARFVEWVRSVRTRALEGRTLISTHEDRPNNWGTHAGAARIAAARYLADHADLARAAQVFRGFLGDRRAYAGFRFGDPEWQADPSAPVAVNPRGSTKAGHVVDGALVDDIRRCLCPVSSTPPKENYQWEAMQGIAAQATLLQTAGYSDVWSWSDQAILRATRFLYDRAQYPAEGDDTFVPYLLDRGLGTSYATGAVSRHGKSLGYTDWTHRARRTTSGRPPGPSPDFAISSHGPVVNRG